MEKKRNEFDYKMNKKKAEILVSPETMKERNKQRK